MALASLTDYLGRFIGRTNGLVERMNSPLPLAAPERQTCEPVHTDSRKYLILRLQSLWAEFCRQIVIVSAIGGRLTLNGQLLAPAPGIRGFADTSKVIGPLDARHAAWHQPSISIQAAQDLQVSNYHQLGLGLSSVNLTDLSRTRNYIVHPNERTRRNFAQTARNLGLFDVDPASLVTTIRPGGATLFEEWIGDFQAAATNAVR